MLFSLPRPPCLSAIALPTTVASALTLPRRTGPPPHICWLGSPMTPTSLFWKPSRRRRCCSPASTTTMNWRSTRVCCAARCAAAGRPDDRGYDPRGTNRVCLPATVTTASRLWRVQTARHPYTEPSTTTRGRGFHAGPRPPAFGTTLVVADDPTSISRPSTTSRSPTTAPMR